MKRLLVIIPDRISDILSKGEYQPRYYNPGEVFDEVHIMMTNDDAPDLAALQRTAGKAKLLVHNYPEDATIESRVQPLLWRRALRRWADKAVQLAARVRPSLIRCHGADLNGFLASEIRRRLGTPYVLSLHINPDVNPPRRHIANQLTREQRRRNRYFEMVERTGLSNADLVMPVYESIIPYLQRMGVSRYKVLYNALNGDSLREKTDYGAGTPFRCISVGRLIEEKSPENIIRAVHELPGVELTVVGDGPKAESLHALVDELGMNKRGNFNERVVFEPAIPNDELCARLPDYDLFVVQSQYFELNKCVLEALLTGMPVVISRREGQPVPELERAGITYMVDNSPAGYRDALARLVSDKALREDLGRNAFRYAQEHWAPERSEARYADIYRRLAQ